MIDSSRMSFWFDFLKCEVFSFILPVSKFYLGEGLALIIRCFQKLRIWIFIGMGGYYYKHLKMCNSALLFLFYLFFFLIDFYSIYN